MIKTTREARGTSASLRVALASLVKSLRQRSAHPTRSLVCTENLFRIDCVTESPKRQRMIALLWFFLTLFASPFKSKSRLEAENAALRHQLIVLQRRVSGRVQLTHGDRLFLVTLYRWFPSILKAITIIRPETLVRWHRAGFRRYWRWKSRSLERPTATRCGPAGFDPANER
jgi:hypothetical protein